MGVTKNQSVLIGINTQTFTANVEVASNSHCCSVWSGDNSKHRSEWCAECCG